MMIMLCLWDFSEQIEKLVTLFCTSDKHSTKFQAWVHFVPS
jgi:hypothetical protein